jgi:4-diphosphocytidyl-2-C-methyl-D-erythritol kinase
MLIRQDGPTVMVWAPAKLNLLLRILGQRPDGYHELVTLIVAVSRFDTLTLTPRRSTELELDCRWATGCSSPATGKGRKAKGETASADLLPPAEQNLVYKALQLLRARSGCEQGARVELVKRIPPASGLGGGSSDAAAALVAGNLAWQLGYSRDELMPMAAELGSDVPFFLRAWRGDGSSLAVCRGRGERVEAARTPAGLQLVIARPAAGLSTVEVYRRYKVSHAKRPSPDDSANVEANVATLLAALSAGRTSEAAAAFANDLQPPAIEISPAISRLAQDFAALDPLAHQMSGSGSAYFGWFRNAAHARRAAGRLRHRGYPHVWHVQTI